MHPIVQDMSGLHISLTQITSQNKTQEHLHGAGNVQEETENNFFIIVKV
jgi:hypothetical protein